MLNNHKAPKRWISLLLLLLFSPRCVSLHSLEHAVQIESERALGVEFLAF